MKLRTALKRAEKRACPDQNLQLGGKNHNVHAVITDTNAMATVNATMGADPNVLRLIIDSGATVHVLRDKSMLTDYTTFSNPYPVKDAGGKIHKAEGVGTLVRTVYTTGGRRTIRIPEVLCIPSFTLDILSVRKMRNSGFGPHFPAKKKGDTYIDTPNNEIINIAPGGSLDILNLYQAK